MPGKCEVEKIPQKRTSERGKFIHVPRIPCREGPEVVKSIPQERIPERMGKLNEVDPVLLRAVKQYLDTERESPSRFFERLRERIMEQVEKEKNPSVFLTV